MVIPCHLSNALSIKNKSFEPKTTTHKHSDIKLIITQTESGNDVSKLSTVAEMNCLSIKNKEAVFNIFIDEHQPI